MLTLMFALNSKFSTNVHNSESIAMHLAIIVHILCICNPVVRCSQTWEREINLQISYFQPKIIL